MQKRSRASCASDQVLCMATPIGFEPTISTVTGWHVNRYTTGPPVITPGVAHPGNLILFGGQEGCQRDAVGLGALALYNAIRVNADREQLCQDVTGRPHGGAS